MQDRRMPVRASDVKTCLVSNESSHVSLEHVYNQYLLNTQNNDGSGVHH